MRPVYRFMDQTRGSSLVISERLRLETPEGIYTSSSVDLPLEETCTGGCSPSIIMCFQCLHI